MATADKYDRQLRLWGVDGQRRLATTHILLLHASATGAETLKNLVLPGVQKFTIVDDHLITQADVTNNFFVTSAHLGESRAQVVTKLLLEMNADVAGTYRHASPAQVLFQEPQFLDQFQLVIATQVLDDSVIRTLGELCAEKRIPLLIANSYGLFGSLRVQVLDHTILDAKPEPPLMELRLAQPFPALAQYAADFDLDALSSIEHAHVPFVVLLLQGMDKWKASHDGQAPATFADKTAFRQFVQSMTKGPAGHELNFIEAGEHAYKAYAPPLMPEEVVQVLQTAKAMELSSATPPFWLLARSLADFVDANLGLLPVTGVVPDMTASTDTYVALQHVYRTKAEQDAQQVHAFLLKHLASIGMSENTITKDDVAAFCKNAYCIAMLRTRAISDELAQLDWSAVDLEEEDKQQSCLIWYLLLRAVQSFVPAFGRHPGAVDSAASSDAQWLLAKAQALAPDATVAQWITNAHAEEMTRACEVEMHTTASLLGGMTSQEAIKLITHQFVPLDHTYIFNGICGAASTYAL